VGDAPLNHRVANNAYTVSVGDHDGTFEETRLFNPSGAGHLTISVLGKPTREDSVVHGIFSPRKDSCDAGSNRALADLQLSFSQNQSSVADKDATDIGDSVEFTGSAVKRNTKIARARFPGCFPLSERDEWNEEKKYR
jgi:hypothetical protein